MYKSITISGSISEYYDKYSVEHEKALEAINKEIANAAGGKIVDIITTKVPLEQSDGRYGYKVTTVITYVIGSNIQA